MHVDGSCHCGRLTYTAEMIYRWPAAALGQLGRVAEAKAMLDDEKALRRPQCGPTSLRPRAMTTVTRCGAGLPTPSFSSPTTRHLGSCIDENGTPGLPLPQPSSETGRRFDKLPRHLLEPGNRVAFRPSSARRQQGDFLNPSIAIAFQIVSIDRLSVGRHREPDIGTVATVGLQ